MSTITGTTGNETLIGTTGDDTIISGQGNDTIYGGKGADTVVYSGAYSSYTITTLYGGKNSAFSGYQVQANSPSTKMDAIGSDVEYLQFSDGKASLSNGTVTFAATSSGGNASSTKAKVFLGSGGDIFNIASSGTTLTGNSGTDTIKLLSGVTGVKTDANVERIELSGNLASYKFVVVAGTGEQIQNATGAIVATIPSLNQTATLAFTDGSAPLMQTGGAAFTLGGVSTGTTTGAITATLNAADTSSVGTTGTTKAKVFLGSGGDSFDVASSGTTLNGNAGMDTIRILSGITGIKTDANVERIELPGNLASYKFVVVAGTGEQIQNTAGAVVATIPSLNQTTTLAFTDGSAPLVQTGGAAFTLGGVSIGTTAGAITATLNTADKSTVTAASGPAAVTIIVISGTLVWDGPTVNTTYTFAKGNYSATITGFGPGDILSLGGEPLTVLSDANLNDGIKQFQLADPSGNATITLTGLTPAQDAGVFNQSSFNTVFGTGTIVP